MADSEGIRDAIYRAGVDLFLEVGFERATMRELARRAGVGLGTIYGYFPNKDAILLEFLAGVISTLRSTAEDVLASGLGPDITIRRLITAHLGYLSRHSAVTRLLFSDSQSLRPESQATLAVERERYRAMIADLVRSAQASGAFRRDVGADWAATALLGAVGAAIMAWLGLRVQAVVSSGPLLELDEAADQAFDMVMHGLRMR